MPLSLLGAALHYVAVPAMCNRFDPLREVLALKHTSHNIMRSWWCTAGSYVVFTGSGIESVRPVDEQEKVDRITQRVSQRVKRMLFRIEEDLDKADQSIGDRMHLLDTDNDGLISRRELEEALTFLQACFWRLLLGGIRL